MQRNQSPFGIERRLTPELLDHYIAKARAERAEAIGAFFTAVALCLAGLARQAWRRRPGRPRARSKSDWLQSSLGKTRRT